MESDSVSWTRIASLIKILTAKVQATGKEFNSISTVSRGGLVPSRLMADHLDIHEILVDKNKVPSDSLFVDDIYDSGDTFKKVISEVKDPNLLIYATLFARRGKRYPKQLIFAQQTKGNEYVVYPWDRLEHKRMKKFQK
jgi:uncharacterized protein